MSENTDPDRLYEDDSIKEAVTRIVEKHGSMNWEIGDEALALRKLYGHGAVTKFGQELTLQGLVRSADTVRAYARVANAYSNANRFASLSWTHHFILSKRENRLEWLNRAAKGKWSVKKLGAELIRTAIRVKADAVSEDDFEPDDEGNAEGRIIDSLTDILDQEDRQAELIQRSVERFYDFISGTLAEKDLIAAASQSEEELRELRDYLTSLLESVEKAKPKKRRGR